MFCNNLGLFFSHFHFLLHVLQKTIGSRFLSWGLRDRVHLAVYRKMPE